MGTAEGVMRAAATIIRFLLWLLFWGALASVVFLLSTDVGKERIRRELERAYGARFQGQLHLGEVELLSWDRIRLCDVGIRDPEGVPVLWFDTLEVAFEPLELVRRRIVLRSVRLAGLELALFRHAPERPLALLEAVAPRRVPRPEPSRAAWWVYVDRLRWQRADVFWSEGRPRQIRSSSGSVHLEWAPEFQLLEVSRLQALLPEEGIVVQRLDGQLYLDSAHVELNRFRLETERSQLSWDIRLRGAGWRDSLQRLGREALYVSLGPSRVALSELQPWTALPVRDTLWVEVRAEGRLDRIELRTFRLGWRQSTLQLRGGIRGLPDWRRSFVNLVIDSGQLLRSDWAPYATHLGLSVPFPEWLALEGRLTGFWRDWTAELRLDGGAEAGSLELDLNAKFPRSDLPRYAGAVHLKGWDAVHWLGDRAPLIRLTGRLQLTGQGLDGRRALLGAQGYLVSSRLGGMHIDSLQLGLRWGERRLEGAVELYSPEGLLFAAGEAYLSEDRLWPESLSLRGRFQDLDLARMEVASLQAPLSGRWSLRMHGADEEAFSGLLELDLDSIAGQRDPFWLRLELESQPTGRKWVHLNSNALEADLEGNARWNALAALLRYWGARWGGYAAALRARIDSARAELQFPFDSTAWFRLRWRPKELSRLAAWWADLRGLFWSGVGLLEMRADVDSLSMHLRFWADSLRLGSVGARSVALEVGARSGNPGSENWMYRADLRVQHLEVARRRLRSMQLQAAYANRLTQGYLALEGEDPNLLLQTSGLLLQEEAQSRLTLIDLYIGTPTYAWKNAAEAQFVLRPDAWRVEGLQLLNGPQRLLVSGGLQANGEDSLEVRLEGLHLEELSELLRLPVRLAGELEAGLRIRGWTRSWQTLVGRVQVRNLGIDEALLGDLEAQSYLDPSGTRLHLRAHLRKDLPPGRIGIPNEAELIGTWALQSQTRWPVEGELRVQVLDLFFLEYLLPDLFSRVSGWASGRLRLFGHQGGIALEGEARIEPTRVRIARFEAELIASGRVRFLPQAVVFDELLLQDDRGGTGRLQGRIGHDGQWSNFLFDLSGEARNLLVLDNPEQVGELFYGTVSASGRFTLTGTQLRPVLWIDATADARSELFLTVQGEEPTEESGFIVYLEPVPLLDSARTVRAGAPLRPMAQTSPEPSFLDRLQMLLNISVPEGATVWLVFDPRIGDELRAVGSGRLQLVLRDGRFSTFGTFTVSQGEYRFTARDLFVRRFELEPGGQLRWDGDPINAQLALSALYRTRVDVSPPGSGVREVPIPLGIRLRLSGRMQSPEVALEFTLLEETTDPQIRARVTQLNQSENRLLEAISVLVTGRLWQSGGLGGNSPLGGLLTSGGTTTGLEFLANQVNLFLRGLLENLDIQLDLQDLQRGGALNVDIALRLFNDRLLIRRVGTIGGGAWSASESASQNASQWFGDLTISFQLNRRMSVEFFHRSGWSYWQVSPDTYGLGLRYRTHFPAWRYVLGRYPQTSLTNKSATPSTIKPDEEPR